MNFFENITFRKTRTRSLNDESKENSLNSSTIDGSTSSLPNISKDESNEYVQGLQSQIEQLTSQLNSAHEEIKNLNIENTELRKSLGELTTINEVIKKATKKLSSEAHTPRKGSQTSTPKSSQQNKPKRGQIKKNLRVESIQTSASNLSTSSRYTAPHESKGDGDVVFDTTKKLCIISTNKTNKPGRVVTLIQSNDSNSKVWGVAYKIRSEDAAQVSQHLDFREKNGYSKRTVTFHPKDNIEPFQLTLYVATEDNESYAGEASIEEIAKQVLSCQGPSGTNKEYLYNLAAAMRELAPDVEDDHLFSLEAAVRRLDTDTKKT